MSKDNGGHGGDSPGAGDGPTTGEEAEASTYPSSPGSDGTPQEPISGESSDAPEPEHEASSDESEVEPEPTHSAMDADSGAGPAEGDPDAGPQAGPEDKQEPGGGSKYQDDDDGGSGSSQVPGAAKASEPHERDSRNLNAPPPPTRSPSGTGVEPAEPAEPAADPDTSSGTDRVQDGQATGATPVAAGATPDTAVAHPVPPSNWQGAPFDPQPQVRPRQKSSKAPLFLGIGIAAALILGIILLVTILTGTGDPETQASADSNGVIAEDVSPFDFEAGQCFTAFSDATQPATVVTCETPHQAQLVNTFSYEDDAEFPGEEALATRADELCRDTQLSEEANEYEDRLRQQTAYPQPESWQAGDRRVDCFIRITSGEITGSLIE